MAVTMFAAGSFAGRVQHRIGAKASLVIGSAVSTVAYVLLLAAHDTPLPVYAATGILGVGVALGFSAMATLVAVISLTLSTIAAVAIPRRTATADHTL
jgi:hypothetical protein